MRSKSVVLIPVCAFFLNIACVPIARSQQSGCTATITDAEGFKVRYVRFFARYQAIVAPEPGTPYTAGLASSLNTHFHDALVHETVREDVEGATEFQLLDSISPENAGEVAVRFVSPCVRVVRDGDCTKILGSSSPKCVDIEMRAFSLRIGTRDPGKNILDNSRSNQPTLFSRVPGPLLALKPHFGFGHDRKYGSFSSLGISSNLFDLRRNLEKQPLEVRKTRLDVVAQGSKSLENSFYDARTSLELSHHSSSRVDTVSLQAGFAANHDPLGTGNYLHNDTSVGGNLRVRFGLQSLSLVNLGVNFISSNNRFDASPSTAFVTSSEKRFTARVVADGELARGFSRLATWIDGGYPDKLSGSYRRVAGLWGYERDFMVAPHQSISVEALLGAGKNWGAVPPYDRYFGGNSETTFLYESANSWQLATAPRGPLVRSFGVSQATVQTAGIAVGGSSYFHLNLNVGIPIPKWSRPLIPDLPVDGLFQKDANCKLVLDADGNPVPENRNLGQILKNQGVCSKNTLKKIFEKQGLSAADAQSKAEKELRSINSILEFLTDRANLISVKPIVMFDVAKINGDRVAESRARYGLGGGFQFTVVIAKFEAGYVSGIRRLPSDPPGNFVARLVFQNLF